MTERPIHEQRFTTVTISAAGLAAVLAMGAYLLARFVGQPLPLQIAAMFVAAAVVYAAVWGVTRPWWRPAHTIGGER